MTAITSKSAAPERVCPTCGELLQASRCPECAPIEPARSYAERVTQPLNGAPGALGNALAHVVDVRRATGEWVTRPDELEPQTRRAHPTLVRSALAEAEARAKDKVARAALLPAIQSTGTRPRIGTTTAPRLRSVTPLPPPPEDEPPPVLADSTVEEAASVEAPRVAEAAPRISPVVSEPVLALATVSTFDEPADEPDRRARLFWFALAGGVALVFIFAAL